MSNEYVISLLKSQGFRITKQRKLIIDIILKNDGASCKDIYYEVISKDNSIGTATVYRMIRLLEDVGIVKHVDMITLSNNV
ncbi:MAG: ferric uptake regulator family protein [Butyrivibrio sp.]|nr:ferric uptake regulator family protein [Butyrivibrio sp.]